MFMSSLVNKLEDVKQRNSYVFANLYGICNDSCLIYDAFGDFIGRFSTSYFQKCHKKVFGFKCKTLK